MMKLDLLRHSKEVGQIDLNQILEYMKPLVVMDQEDAVTEQCIDKVQKTFKIDEGVSAEEQLIMLRALYITFWDEYVQFLNLHNIRHGFLDDQQLYDVLQNSGDFTQIRSLIDSLSPSPSAI
jgi:hypothetical protein